MALSSTLLDMLSFLPDQAPLTFLCLIPTSPQTPFCYECLAIAKINVQHVFLISISWPQCYTVDLAVQLCAGGLVSWSRDRDGLLLIEAVSCWQQPAVPNDSGSTEMSGVFFQADLPRDLSSGSICSSHNLAGFRESGSSSTLWTKVKAWLVSIPSRR